jgi:DNA-binding NarL/FixJ family response regulator
MNRKSGVLKPKIRVFLVDDHPIVRRGFQLLLSLEPDMSVCGESDNGPEALQKILNLKPDVAIIDLSLRIGGGLELIKQLRAQPLKTKLLVFTMLDESIYAERVLRAGADGYITKEEGTEKAILALRTLLDGKRYLSAQVTDRLIQAKIDGKTRPIDSVESLSDRELEILEHIGGGMGSRAIAQKLGVSLKTVESHREHIKSKLSLSGAAELVNYAHTWAHRKQG